MVGRVGLTKMCTRRVAVAAFGVAMIQRTVSPAETGPDPVSCSPGLQGNIGNGPDTI